MGSSMKYLPWKAEQRKARAKKSSSKRETYQPSQHSQDCTMALHLFHRIFYWEKENGLMRWANRPTQIQDYPKAFVEIGVTWKDVAHIRRIKAIFHNWAILKVGLTDTEEAIKPRYKNSSQIINICIDILTYDVHRARAKEHIKIESAVSTIEYKLKKIIDKNINVEECLLELSKITSSLKELES